MLLLASAYVTATVLGTASWVQGRARNLAEWGDERGDIVSSIVLVGVFVLLASVVGLILWKVTLAKANTVAGCVSSSSSCANSTP
jgi:hypothetical protein